MLIVSEGDVVDDDDDENDDDGDDDLNRVGMKGLPLVLDDGLWVTRGGAGEIGESSEKNYFLVNFFVLQFFQLRKKNVSLDKLSLVLNIFRWKIVQLKRFLAKSILVLKVFLY